MSCDCITSAREPPLQLAWRLFADLIYRGATADSKLEKQSEEVAKPEQKQQDVHQEEATEQEQHSESSDEKTCDCNGLECMCCVDFNMTFIDLGKGKQKQTSLVLLPVSG